MNDHSDPPAEPVGSSNTLSPLPGEPGIPNVAARPRSALSIKGLLAVALLLGSLVAVSVVSVQRFVGSGHRSDDTQAGLVGNRPAAASTEPRRLDLTPPPAPSAPATPAPRIPALVPTADEVAEPIGVHRTGSAAASSRGTRPEDAPVLLVTTRPGATTGVPGGSANDPGAPSEGDGTDSSSDNPLDETRRNLDRYQRQLQGVLDHLTRHAGSATGGSPGSTGMSPAGGIPAGGTQAPLAGLFGGQLEASATPRIAAGHLGDRSLTLPQGTAFTCALKTRVISAASGLIGCQVQRNVFSDDGRVLLIERGSHLDGEYRIGSVRPGTVRIPVLWTRLRTPLGVTVDLDSPGTGPLGESGIDGFVDNRWGERLGAAMLLSLIDDSVKLVIQNQGSTGVEAGHTVLLPSTTSNTSKLAEKVLDSTINIPPLIYQNQGGIVGIYVARDLDFSSVYTLQPTPEGAR